MPVKTGGSAIKIIKSNGSNTAAAMTRVFKLKHLQTGDYAGHTPEWLRPNAPAGNPATEHP